jgi:acyl-coenzyme A thioesterase PaaI-like protein
MCSHTGVLHGGINTTIVDEVAGRLAVMEASQSLMAVNLNVNLRKSVKAPGLVLVKAWIDRPPEGRKVWVKCRIEQGDVTCIEAEGLWLKVNMYKM